jgi:hypothetical protein
MPQKLKIGLYEHREMGKNEIRCLEYPKSLILGIEKRKMDNSDAMKQKRASAKKQKGQVQKHLPLICAPTALSL